MTLELFDVTIVGGGPAGLYAAFYSGMRDLKTKLIDSGDELGGRMRIYKEKMIWDVGGVTPTMGGHLIEQLIAQAKTFDPTIILNAQVTDFEKNGEGQFIITTEDGQQHLSKTLILAVGYGMLSLQKLEVEGADRFEVTNLHYTVQELEQFRGKNIVISGGGDSAVDWANELEKIASQVTVIHRRYDFGGHERNVRTMKNSTVKIVTPYEIKSLQSSDGRCIEKVIVANCETQEEQTVCADAVIINHGFKYDYGKLEQWGLKLSDGCAHVDGKCSTNIAGIYGAGDFTDYDSKVRLITGAFSDAVLAVNSANHFINPQARQVAMVSSHNAIFKEKNKQLGLDDTDYYDN
ncbi:NAD(P)/FAD-dependent oxidoreductase [Kurthia sibirica]|uniref:Ferredoxin--NADP reductase n=1 Tax=Kurthia sibirica TaxID=202750 RepID=A0A2U3AQ35_9BACL|nr:NAD(P)/FAD-dependent oxidoreductase [Kurthia sibirica]PWI26652.1 thioredoxin reductase [Kurthia sibirica]GEK32914.1 ferredoxin--NADP reductase 1 [Kurthia sibirica]